MKGLDEKQKLSHLFLLMIVSAVFSIPVFYPSSSIKAETTNTADMSDGKKDIEKEKERFIKWLEKVARSEDCKSSCKAELSRVMKEFGMFLAGVRLRMKEKEQKISSLEIGLKRARNIIKELERKEEELKKEIGKLTEYTQIETEEKKKLKKRILKLQRRIRELNHDVKTCRSNLEDMKEKWDKVIKSMKKDIYSLQKEISEVKKIIEEKRNLFRMPERKGSKGERRKENKEKQREKSKKGKHKKGGKRKEEGSNTPKTKKLGSVSMIEFPTPKIVFRKWSSSEYVMFPAMVLSRIYATALSPGDEIYFVGSWSVEGDPLHNIYLGKEREKITKKIFYNVYRKVQTSLTYIIPDTNRRRKSSGLNIKSAYFHIGEGWLARSGVIFFSYYNLLDTIKKDWLPKFQRRVNKVKNKIKNLKELTETEN